MKSLQQDTIGTTVNCPVYGSVLVSEVLYVHMSMQGMSNGAEQRCHVKEVAAFQRCPLNSLFFIVFNYFLRVPITQPILSKKQTEAN